MKAEIISEHKINLESGLEESATFCEHLFYWGFKVAFMVHAALDS